MAYFQGDAPLRHQCAAAAEMPDLNDIIIHDNILPLFLTKPSTVEKSSYVQDPVALKTSVILIISGIIPCENKENIYLQAACFSGHT